MLTAAVVRRFGTHSARHARHNGPISSAALRNKFKSDYFSTNFFLSGLRRVSTAESLRKQQSDALKARNKTLLMYTAAVAIVGVGVTYAAVPLYRMFCSATGFGGTPNTSASSGKFAADRLVPVSDSHRIRVRFNADVSDSLPWSFIPQQKYIDVLPGESSLAFYRAKNKSDKDIIGIATYNVTPDKMGPYFAKMECFCFEEQKLLAGEEVDMPLLFFIDKDILDDPSVRQVTDVVLSYTFFRARRNKYGHLEPDAEEDVVEASKGFAGYINAPKVEDRQPKTA